MSNIDTISEFLLHAGTEFRVFDMARGIRPLSTQTFLDIENGSVAAPYPRQQHAWFGILFFNKQASQEQYIWFVKLPIDEQGLVISAARRQFLQIVVEALGKELDNKNNPNNQLPENPFTFVPNQHLLADFNAKCRASLDIGESKHLAKVIEYFQAPQQHDWQELSVQGIADFCTDIINDQHQILLTKTFDNLPPQMQTALCTSLENHVLPKKLTALLINWAEEQPFNEQRIQSALRAVTQSSTPENVEAFILNLLKSAQFSNPNLLILIGARHWQHLNQPELLAMFIDKLVECGNDIFTGLYADLVQIPEIRNSMLGVLRWPHKSEKLTHAIGELFGQNQ